MASINFDQPLLTTFNATHWSKWFLASRNGTLIQTSNKFLDEFYRTQQNFQKSGHRHLVWYRILQLVSTNHNNAWTQPSMPVGIGGIVVAETVSLYILVTSHDQIPFLVLLIFIIIAVDCMCMYVVFKIASYPYTKSCQFIEFMKTKDGTKWIKRFMSSCPPSRLTMGDGTFFDRLTAFVVWKKSMDFLITLLLM